MKKLFLIIFPSLSLILAILLYGEFAKYRSQTAAIEQQNSKIETLNLMMGNYFVMRTETLHMISPITSKEIKESAFKIRVTALLALQKNVEEITQAISQDPAEEKLLTEMKNNLNETKKVILNASTSHPESTIEKMLKTRVPLRISVESLFKKFKENKFQIIQERSLLIEKMKLYAILFFLLNTLTILSVIFNLLNLKTKRKLTNK